jgi:23S rRNA (adenine2503-C2)-methyltransferase
MQNMRDFPRLPDGKVDIKSLDLDGLTCFLGQIGEAESRSLLLYKQIWQQGARTFSEMENIARSTLRKMEQEAGLDFLESDQILDSGDGTRKFLWKLPSGGLIESVLIPDLDRGEGRNDRMTLCVSSQWGCAMKCSFCLTGDLGLRQQLTAAQIANQVLQVSETLPAGSRITNIVMMGMGEPLHNYGNLVAALRNMMHDDALNLSHRKITVSTVGLLPGLRKLASELPVNLAISLNASTEEQRRQVMPITHRYSLADLMETCNSLPLPRGKRIAFEYVMMAGFNDDLADAERLLKLLDPNRSKVNLIPYNENPNRKIRRPPFGRVKAFQHHLVTNGLHCSIRTTRGIDISAACGQLGKGAINTYEPNEASNV